MIIEIAVLEHVNIDIQYLHWNSPILELLTIVDMTILNIKMP
jgi:hypothetical protein